jgi:Ni,Fe-hydrogenase III small subunit
MFAQLRKALRTGIVTEPPPALPPGDPVPELGARVAAGAAALLGRSLHIRQVDAGSCNGCELEISNLASPFYDLERFGLHFVASPRHADCLMVTGPVTRNMAEPLRRTYEATPSPKLVVAVGDCALDAGIFRGSYAVLGGVDAVVPVDVRVPGCPPTPEALLRAILQLLAALAADPRRLAR